MGKLRVTAKKMIGKAKSTINTISNKELKASIDALNEKYCEILIGMDEDIKTQNKTIKEKTEEINTFLETGNGIVEELKALQGEVSGLTTKTTDVLDGYISNIRNALDEFNELKERNMKLHEKFAAVKIMTFIGMVLAVAALGVGVCILIR